MVSLKEWDLGYIVNKMPYLLGCELSYNSLNILHVGLRPHVVKKIEKSLTSNDTLSYFYVPSYEGN